jgi:hypothetical protein
MGVALNERTLAKQVINRGVPVVDGQLEQTLAGKRRVFSWSAHPVMESGQVLGALLFQGRHRPGAVDPAGSCPARASRSPDRDHARYSPHGRRTGRPAVPELTDSITIDLLDQVLQGENVPRTDPGVLHFRRVAVRDTSKTRAEVSNKVGELRYPATDIDRLLARTTDDPYSVNTVVHRPQRAPSLPETYGRRYGAC